MLESEGQFEPMPIIFIENCNIQEASSPVAAMLPFISIQAVIYVKDKKIGKGVRRRSFFIILAGKRPESLWSLQMVKSLRRTFTSTCSQIKVLMEGLEDEINIFWEKMNLLWYLGCQAINPNPISTHQAWLVCTVFVNQTSYFLLGKKSIPFENSKESWRWVTWALCHQQACSRLVEILYWFCSGGDWKKRETSR